VSNVHFIFTIVTHAVDLSLLYSFGISEPYNSIQTDSGLSSNLKDQWIDGLLNQERHITIHNLRLEILDIGLGDFNKSSQAIGNQCDICGDNSINFGSMSMGKEITSIDSSCIHSVRCNRETASNLASQISQDDIFWRGESETSKFSARNVDESGLPLRSLLVMLFRVLSPVVMSMLELSISPVMFMIELSPVMSLWARTSDRVVVDCNSVHNKIIYPDGCRGRGIDIQVETIGNNQIEMDCSAPAPAVLGEIRKTECRANSCGYDSQILRIGLRGGINCGVD